ncbi:class I SAM-dependent methyltransferase [Actinomadura hibisca]|uniref:class I SAM-dependent methyltransferase n=1 Tax=Actinomadura hibisca TaxID=68565 RepID=UPI000B04A2D3|nr:class I SAM-dependent methyltransferase [Actinomadura hibisca]
MPPLLDDAALEGSSVVANCAMNRERSLTGSNGYGRELGLDIMEVLAERCTRSPRVRWLDLCCGSGRALLEATQLTAKGNLAEQVEIVGLDLVDHFLTTTVPRTLRLITGSATEWEPNEKFDLITCVHGLHYIGDKLGVLKRVASWLTKDGVFIANLDTRSIRRSDGTPAGRQLTYELRQQGFTYDTTRRRISREGSGKVQFPYRYLGADDQAGPNYIGQPAVDSFYDHVHQK